MQWVYITEMSSLLIYYRKEEVSFFGCVLLYGSLKAQMKQNTKAM